jgi:hypothetical protein
LGLLKKLHDILGNNHNKIKNDYEDLIKIIQDKSNQEVIYFEKLVLKIIKSEKCESIKD